MNELLRNFGEQNNEDKEKSFIWKKSAGKKGFLAAGLALRLTYKIAKNVPVLIGKS